MSGVPESPKTGDRDVVTHWRDVLAERWFNMRQFGRRDDSVEFVAEVSTEAHEFRRDAHALVDANLVECEGEQLRGGKGDPVNLVRLDANLAMHRDNNALWD